MIGLRLSPEATERVDAYAQRHGLSRSEAVRRLVEKSLDAE
jgi:predicted DNA-binding protein